MIEKTEVEDSTVDTLLHMRRVSELLMKACMILMRRAAVHDDSKLRSPEKELFDALTPQLKGAVYGSEEYDGFLEAMKPALDHHYACNPHHPQHYSDGVSGMNLFDVIEMFLDWKASSERQDTGNIVKSIEFNKKRFKICGQLTNIFKNTAKYMGW